MEFGFIILFGAIIIALVTTLVASLFFVGEDKKRGRFTGNIVVVISDEKEMPAEIAINELILAAERLSDKGIFLDIYIVNNSKNNETKKLLEIFSRRYYKLHIIDSSNEETKTGKEILHIGE